MPNGAAHKYFHKETNSQPSGRSDSKTSIHMGPAVSGNVKPNVSMKASGLGRALRGKPAPTKSAKQRSNQYA